MDSITKEYLKDNSRFADIVNYKIYGGKHIVSPTDLKEKDTSEVISFLSKDGNKNSIKKTRDLLKYCEIKQYRDTVIALFGIENQTHIHYAMPVRNMLYDALNYEAQIRALTNAHRKTMDLRGAEFISGISKDDRIIPIVTITVYWGADEWDGPKALSDMFCTKDNTILKYVSDYSINLVCPHDMTDDEMDSFSSQLKYAFKAIKYSSSEDIWTRVLYSDDGYKELDIETATIINEFTSIKLDIYDRDKGDKINMCKAWDDHFLSGKREGHFEGKIEGKIEVFINCIKNGIDEEKAKLITGLSDDMIIEAKKQLV